MVFFPHVQLDELGKNDVSVHNDIFKFKFKSLKVLLLHTTNLTEVKHTYSVFQSAVCQGCNVKPSVARLLVRAPNLIQSVLAIQFITALPIETLSFAMFWISSKDITVTSP